MDPNAVLRLAIGHAHPVAVFVQFDIQGKDPHVAGLAGDLVDDRTLYGSAGKDSQQQIFRLHPNRTAQVEVATSHSQPMKIMGEPRGNHDVLRRLRLRRTEHDVLSTVAHNQIGVLEAASEMFNSCCLFQRDRREWRSSFDLACDIECYVGIDMVQCLDLLVYELRCHKCCKLSGKEITRNETDKQDEDHRDHPDEDISHNQPVAQPPKQVSLAPAKGQEYEEHTDDKCDETDPGRQRRADLRIPACYGTHQAKKQIESDQIRSEAADGAPWPNAPGMERFPHGIVVIRLHWDCRSIIGEPCAGSFC